jgi:hypothetical protein
MTHARRLAMGIVFVTAASATFACGLRQNLRNQFLSYRGAWHCEKKECGQAGMTRSTRGSRSGDVEITSVKMNPRVAMVINAGAAPQTFTAELKCGGQTQEVPGERVLAPGTHKIAGQNDSYVVLIDATDYAFGDCKEYRLHTQATWENGKRTYDLESGLSVQ